MSELEQQGAADQQQEQDALPGVVHMAAVVVQCLRCVEQGREGILRAQLVNEDPSDLEGVDVQTVPCPPCSSELGKPMVVPIVMLAGEQVAEFFNEADDQELLDFGESEIAEAEANTDGLDGGDAGDGGA